MQVNVLMKCHFHKADDVIPHYNCNAMLLHMQVCSLTENVNGAISRASIDEALSCGMHGREVRPDQGSQHFVASVRHQAVVLRVLDQMVSGWVLFPSVIPAHHPNLFAQPCKFLQTNGSNKVQGQSTDTDCGLHVHTNKRQLHCFKAVSFH